MSKRKEYLSFFLAAAAKPWKIGAIAPSSRGLAETMLQRLPVGTTQSVVEIGPGTGAITEVLLPRLKNPSQYLGLDINPDFIRKLSLRFPEVRFQQDSAENLSRHVSKSQEENPTVEMIVCSLPWSIWTSKQQKKLLDSILEPLAPGGTFVTFAYWPTLYSPAGLKFRRLLGQTFKTIETSRIVWRNLPPAVAYFGNK
jgi:phospholipid N-methyltransferase